MLFWPPAKLTEEDKFYAELNEMGINVIDRVNGKPVDVYHYSIDRPNANWKAPQTYDDEYDDEYDSKNVD